MAVRRIVADLWYGDPAALAGFYRDLLGLDILMDMGWIVTLGTARSAPVQLTCASEGGNGTDLPHLSIEVDDLDDVLARARAMMVPIDYGPVDEPWGVRRFFLRDPGGRLLNILTHADQERT